ncbi:MAG: DNA polymerase III subunit delta [Micrococcales bacterium]
MSSAKQLSWRRAHPAPIMLISGAEQYFASVATRSIRNQLREKYVDLEISELNASEYRSGQLLNLASPSLFAEPRLILIDDADRCTDEFIEDGKAYLENPATDTFVLIRHHATSVRGKALLEAIRASDKAVEVTCPKFDKDYSRTDFLNGHFQDAGRQISSGAIKALVDAFSGDVAELAAACNQLIDDNEGAITQEMVDQNFGGRVETSSFKIADAALAGRPSEALTLLRHGLATGLEAVPLVAGLALRVRLLAKISADPRATPASLGVGPWQLNKARAEVQGWSDEALGKAVQMVADADAAAKGAEKDSAYRLERLIHFLSVKGRGI